MQATPIEASVSHHASYDVSHHVIVAFKVDDANDMKAQAKNVGTILLVDLGCIVPFMGILGWIEHRSARKSVKDKN